jgi:LAO/AO transport system kinase
MELVERLALGVRAGDVRALARACRLVDDRRPGYRDLLRALFPHTGRAWIIGITGTPGAGKSTLTDGLIAEFRARHERVAVLAVDPTSPFTGGAILGDRVRMQQHFEDPEVFIRSLATRGALGGLSASASDILRVLDAWQPGVVLVETVGVGQDELAVTSAAHTTLVVMAPGLGDDIQAVKAGILECADVFAVNKADRDGADATARDLAQMIALGKSVSAGARHGPSSLPSAEASESGAWVPPVVRCVATRRQGLDELMKALQQHRSWLSDTPEGRFEKRRRARAHALQTLRDALVDATLVRLGAALEDAVARIEAGEADPYTVCEQLISASRAFR